MATSTATAKTVLTIQKAIEPIYTGGKIEVVSENGGAAEALLLMRSGNKFALRDPTTGHAKHQLELGEEGEESTGGITVYTMKDSTMMITCNSVNLFELWTFTSPSPIRSFKAHASPILVMTHHAKFPLLATGSADHCVRIWDSDKGCCTHNFKGVHGGIISSLAFHPNPAIMQVISGGEDGSLAIWDLLEGRVSKVFKGAHVSAVTAVSITPDGKFLLSAGRDQVANIWPLSHNSSKPQLTIPVMEAIEAAGWLDNQRFYTAGEKGIVRIWDTQGIMKMSSERVAGEGHVISQVKQVGSQLMVVTSDLFLTFLDVDTLKETRLMIGHQGEVTDSVVFGNRLVISSNSPELRAYASASQLIANDDFTCSLLRGGHSEAIIALAASEDLMISGSRDHSAVVWRPDGTIAAKLTGHTDAVSAVAVCHGQKKKSASSVSLVATASADMTLKVWNLSSSAGATLKWTIKAHDKDINSVSFTPNDKLIISASQDKTVKVWRVEDGTLLHTLRGHKRGVWSIAISPVEQVVASVSADRSIKLWSLTDGACLKTLEGHANSVLRVQFIKGAGGSGGGSQLITAGSDGIIKVWDLKRKAGDECITTIDAHSDRIWSMITSNCTSGEQPNHQQLIVTGDASGIIKIWKDVSEEVAAEAIVLRNQSILKEQELSNLMLRKDFKNAANLAMQLEQPHRFFSLLGELVDGRRVEDALSLLSELLEVFTSDEQRAKLLVWIRDWNTSLKRSYTCQLLLHAILKDFSGYTLSGTDREVLQQIKAYNQRHFEKVDGLLINSYLIDFVVNKIK